MINGHCRWLIVNTDYFGGRFMVCVHILQILRSASEVARDKCYIG